MEAHAPAAEHATHIAKRREEVTGDRMAIRAERALPRDGTKQDCVPAFRQLASVRIACRVLIQHRSEAAHLCKAQFVLVLLRAPDPVLKGCCVAQAEPRLPPRPSPSTPNWSHYTRASRRARFFWSILGSLISLNIRNYKASGPTHRAHPRPPPPLRFTPQRRMNEPAAAIFDPSPKSEAILPRRAKRAKGGAGGMREVS
jgi:hypothetical protein